MIKNIFIIILATVLLSISYAAIEMLVPVQTAGKNAEVQIPKGATFRQAVDILAREKLIRDKKVFMILGRLTGSDRKIRAGYYSVWTSMRPLDIFRIIRQGRIIEYEIKVLEGDSLLEIAEVFSGTGIITRDSFMKLSSDPEFLELYKINSPSFEGYIFPDTYTIPKGIKAEEAVGMMIDKMREKTAHLFSEKGEKPGMTEAEILTLASIIEKEAVVDSERPVISAVYHNRLKKNMLLQADPTSIYGIKSSKERIIRSDIRRKTPYNTYVIKGLPPGPIASPGFKSVAAALNPARVPYLYFVSNNDGTHRFSVTLAEHEEAVRSYRDRKKIKPEG
jgi:UPF0755 protein